MRTMNQGSDIGFLKGVQRENNFGLLIGTGKVMRVLPLKEFNPEIIDYYLQQAKQINAEK